MNLTYSPLLLLLYFHFIIYNLQQYFSFPFTNLTSVLIQRKLLNTLAPNDRTIFFTQTKANQKNSNLLSK